MQQYEVKASHVVLLEKNLSGHAGVERDTGLISGLEIAPGIGNGTPLQYSCLENSIGKGAWQTIVHGAPKSQTQLSN